MKQKAIILFFVGLLTAISLSYSEHYIQSSKLIINGDGFNHHVLALSAFHALKNGQFPLRVAEGVFCNLSYPIHQFYSPFTHTFIAILSFINDNIYTGFALSVILMTLLAFLFSYLLIKYLFNDEWYAVTAAFVYICSPYLSITRQLRGAYSEFFAICLLPPLLYFIIKSINKPIFKNLLLSVVFLVLLMHTHLITCFYFIFFSSIFFILHISYLFYSYYKNKNKAL
ncbi:MAG: hypothetical protein LBE31_02615, partial [Deltaproteobacteria bacterium]|nr:hypothetical protein [Deltaproteobacteria bacterium]